MQARPISSCLVLLLCHFAHAADAPTATIGAFIAPIDATASSSQSGAGRTPRKTIDGLLKQHKVAVNTVMEFDNIETLKRSVEVGIGLSILPETAVVNEVKGGLLVRLDFSEGTFTRAIGIIHRRGRVFSAAAREFVQMLMPSVDAVRLQT